MSTPDTSHTTVDRFTTGLRVLITVVLGGIGAAAGFTHTHDWAVHHGQTGWIAWADAVVIECIAIVAGFEVQRDHQARNPRKVTFPLVVLVAGFGVQMAAQVSLAEPTPAGWLAAAMPALGFLVVVKLLMRRTPTPPATPPGPLTRSHPLPAKIAPPAASKLGKLPAGVRKTITAATEEAHTAGRAFTADDLAALINLPDSMATPLLTELNASINHHPVIT
jgi:hypothetical protein